MVKILSAALVNSKDMPRSDGRAACICPACLEATHGFVTRRNELTAHEMKYRNDRRCWRRKGKKLVQSYVLRHRYRTRLKGLPVLGLFEVNRGEFQ